MVWRDYFLMSNEAKQLESLLSPTLIEHDGDLSSTSHTGAEDKIIHLDISQPPLKCALSYAYELKNLENINKFEPIINNARKHLITKSAYVKSILQLEAEAVYFRCQVFQELGGEVN